MAENTKRSSQVGSGQSSQTLVSVGALAGAVAVAAYSLARANRRRSLLVPPEPGLATVVAGEDPDAATGNTPSGTAAGKSDRTLAMDAALADWTVARGAMERLTLSIFGAISLNLTAVAAIAGFVYSGKADHRLLLIIPIVSSVLGLSAVGQLIYIRLTGAYLEDHVRPLIVEYAADRRLFRFEPYYKKNKGAGYLLQALTMGIVFIGTSVLALASTWSSLRTVSDKVLWGFGVVLAGSLAISGLINFMRSNPVDPL